jgi:hypothetical protein
VKENCCLKKLCIKSLIAKENLLIIPTILNQSANLELLPTRNSCSQMLMLLDEILGLVFLTRDFPEDFVLVGIILVCPNLSINQPDDGSKAAFIIQHL